MLNQNQIENKAYKILELVDMEDKHNIDILALTNKYGFVVKNAKFKKEDIIAIVKTLDCDKTIYIKKDLPDKAKRILIGRAFSKYMLEKKEFIISYNDSDINSERLARALLIRRRMISKLVHRLTYIGLPKNLIERELANTFNTTRREIQIRLQEIKKES